MDGPSSTEFGIKWNIKIGDIVKIMRYDADAFGHPAYGILIKKDSDVLPKIGGLKK